MSFADPSGPRAKCDQVVFEAIAKACEIVVTSRRCDATSTASSSNSSRFNLQVPEVARIRAILQRTRGALHVPLRLDVFCEHNTERVLLERWCLEYRVSGMENFLARESIVGDPIVQLRHVCKRIVIWLRTLCCWIRLLPAQVVKTNVGFSLYHHDDNVMELLQQGFLMEDPQSMVATPYGELSWKVVYTPHLRQVAPSLARPIPIPNSRVDRHEYLTRPIVAEPQSAPIKAPINWLPPGRDRDHACMHTYDASRLHNRPKTLPGSTEGVEQQSQLKPVIIRRRHTDIEPIEGIDSMFAESNSKPPERVLSGLSLALLEDSKRRAFHDAPPHVEQQRLFRQQQQNREPLQSQKGGQQMQEFSSNNTSDYGYAYNNHIPWQKIHPSTSKPIDATTLPDRMSPHGFLSPLASTPPGAAFLSFPSTLSSPSQQPVHQAQTSSTLPGTSDPVALTPPFRPRPGGFSVAADPPALSVSSAPPTDNSFPYKSAVPPPLDFLDSSPFQASMLSTHALGAAISDQNACGVSSILQDMRRSLFAGGSSHGLFGEAEDDNEDEELPFAVDHDSASSANLDAGSGTSQSNVSVSAVQFAQKLGKYPRPMFSSASALSSTAAAAGSSVQVDLLADQLAEFRAFGASMNLLGGAAREGETGESSSTASTSNSAPIALRS